MTGFGVDKDTYGYTRAPTESNGVEPVSIDLAFPVPHTSHTKYNVDSQGMGVKIHCPLASFLEPLLTANTIK